MNRSATLVAIALANLAAPGIMPWRAAAQTPAGSDYIARNFKFETGDSLPDLRLHYITLGKPVRDGAGAFETR
jgi:homoserine O-acetyltransferase